MGTYALRGRATLIGLVSADPQHVPQAASAAQLHRGSSVPLYFQLAEILKERIEAGRWPAGERFPSERELADEFAISRTVIRPALDLLESDGQLVRIKGRGTFVTPPKVRWPVAGLARLLALPRAPETRVRILDASEQEPEPDVRAVLELEPGATVLGATAVILSSGTPVYMSNSFIAGERVPGLAALLSAGELGPERGWADDATVRLEGGSATIATAFVSRWEAEQLDVAAGDLCFLIRYVERVAGDDGPRAVEFARVVFRSDVVELGVRPA